MWEQWKWFGAAVWGDQSFCSKWVWNDQSLRWKISDIPEILLAVIQRGAEGIRDSTNKCAPSGNATQCDILSYVVIKRCWIMSAMFLWALCYVCPDAKLKPVSHSNVSVCFFIECVLVASLCFSFAIRLEFAILITWKGHMKCGAFDLIIRHYWETMMLMLPANPVWRIWTLKCM